MQSDHQSTGILYTDLRQKHWLRGSTKKTHGENELFVSGFGPTVLANAFERVSMCVRDVSVSVNVCVYDRRLI